jgi:hypothetical protein
VLEKRRVLHAKHSNSNANYSNSKLKPPYLTLKQPQNSQKGSEGELLDTKSRAVGKSNTGGFSVLELGKKFQQRVDERTQKAKNIILDIGGGGYMDYPPDGGALIDKDNEPFQLTEKEKLAAILIDLKIENLPFLNKQISKFSNKISTYNRRKQLGELTSTGEATLLELEREKAMLVEKRAELLNAQKAAAREGGEV